MDWANTLKNIKDIELGIHCSLFLFGLIIILSGILWVVIGISAGLYVLYILGGSFVDSLLVLNPYLLISVIHIIPGVIINFVSRSYLMEYEK